MRLRDNASGIVTVWYEPKSTDGTYAIKPAQSVQTKDGKKWLNGRESGTGPEAGKLWNVGTVRPATDEIADTQGPIRFLDALRPGRPGSIPRLPGIFAPGAPPGNPSPRP